ncbi:MAG: 1-deoxy-D-xylulose-5-phosphate reductoisomerase [Candidatus Marinimicrobia bacterium]|nr:1-deoxy-D-xylulose-5-phosphate reductoisomerase [Candidatus Neomarinimicrobiota bacterium]
MKKRISIFGSTGSIGVNALAVIDHLPDQFKIVILTANRQWETLVQQTIKYRPETICLVDETHADKVRDALSHLDIEIVFGRDGLLELASRKNTDLMLNALVGSAGMEPTFRAVTAGVDVALSNKESLVMAGSIITKAASENNAKIFPVDSEHSAIWQCLVGESMEDVRRIILTGSGGPFRNRELSTFDKIQPEEALKHPNWDMGNKITIDSATMMNKGLEVIEAHWLFDLHSDKIDIVVHPQSVIHSMVEFNDSSVKAQLGVPDMKVPIQYALTYPSHVEASWKRLDLIEMGTLTFEKPDFQRFPCIKLAFDVLATGGTAAAVLNVANDHAVDLFLKHKICFTDIPSIIETALDKHMYIANPSLEDLLIIEKWTSDMINNGKLL